MSRAMALHEWLAGEVPALPVFNPMIRGLSTDSRELGEGDAFIALAGETTHGLKFAAKAQAAKVAAIVFEAPAPADVSLPDNAVAVPGLRQKLGRLADRFYGGPSKAMAVTGVSRTNGTTSPVRLVSPAVAAGRVGRDAGQPRHPHRPENGSVRYQEKVGADRWQVSQLTPSPSMCSTNASPGTCGRRKT